MTTRTPLADQLVTIEALLERAKREGDWPTARNLSDTRELLRWTLTNADAIKAATIVASDPAVKALREAFPEGRISSIRHT